ncbi:hypothetical protein EGW08_011203 [Elysia chlorotica]|uniref:Pentatricopeptide repeat-containing protein 2, mitochondrial n=1 Tax=Elysia chlorotica TaxID=188477 RepID=A0A3S1B6L1_ELYCH|nr:hypothetical protein EGW08_011203 [Elysia chlorotica]
MDHYLRQRIFKTDELGPNGKEILLNRLHKTRSAREPASSVAFDINDFIHVANSERDLQELERHTRLMSSVAAVSTLRFGASLMRLFHHLNCPEQAYSIYKNDVCRDLLGDNTCHKILMDLLYNNQYYHQVLEVFDTLRHFNIDCATLAFGAHFHINTAGSAQSCILLLNKLHSHRLSQRALHFAAMLCLNQHLPDEAIKCLKLFKKNSLSSNLEMICVAQQRRVGDLLALLEEARVKSEDLKKPLNTRLYADTMSVVRVCMDQAGDEAQKTQFSHLEKELNFNSALSLQKLSTLLDRTVLDEKDFVKARGKRGHIS